MMTEFSFLGNLDNLKGPTLLYVIVFYLFIYLLD